MGLLRLILLVLFTLISSTTAQTVQVRYRYIDNTEQNFGPFSNATELNLGTVPADVDIIWVWSSSPATDHIPRILAQGSRSTGLSILLANPAVQPSFPTDSTSAMPGSSCKNWSGLSLSQDLVTSTRLAASMTGDLLDTITVGKIFRLQVLRSSGATAGGRLRAGVYATPHSSPFWSGPTIEVISLSHGTDINGTISASTGSIQTVEVTGLSGSPSLEGTITSLNGQVDNVIVLRGTIAIASPDGIRCRDGIRLIQANSIAANITANANNGSGGIREMRTTKQSGQLDGVLGGFSGSLFASVIGEAGLSTPALQFVNNQAEPRSATITTTGDLLSDITVSGSNATVLNVTVGGNMHRVISSSVLSENIPANTNAIDSIYVHGITQRASTAGSVVPSISAKGTIGEIHFHGGVLPSGFGNVPKINCNKIGMLKFDANSFVEVGTWLLLPLPTESVTIGELRAQGSLGGRFILKRDESPSEFSIAGNCSAGLHFTLQTGQVLPPVSVGGTFIGSISVLPHRLVDQSGANPPRLEPERALASLTNVCAVAQVNPYADYDGTVSVPVLNTTSSQAGISANLWNSSGIAHGHLSARPADLERLGPVGGGSLGAYPYSLNYADCSPRPVPGNPRRADPQQRPFEPLDPEEEPLDSEVNRNMPAQWILLAQPVVLRFDGYVRSTLSSGSPFLIEYVEYINNAPIFATVNASGYTVTVKRPGDSGYSREASIIGLSGYAFAPGIYRIRLRSDVSNPLLSDCAPPCPSGVQPAPVQPFEYYFNLVADCGQDGTPGNGGPQGCPCQYDTPCEAADFNDDGGIDGTDVAFFFDAWEDGLPAADVNVDGGVNGEDISVFLCWWENGGCS